MILVSLILFPMYEEGKAMSDNVELEAVPPK
jgi:hypothetical protein